MQEQEWLTLREAADALGISEVSARRWVKSGKLAAAQPGRKYLIPRSAVEELLSPKAPAPPPDPAAQRRREFYERIKDLDREALVALSDEIDEEYMRVRPEYDRAKETGAPEFSRLAAELSELSEKGLMVRLTMRIVGKADAEAERKLEALVGAA
jgi:excisionase family DNA binding protein